MSFGAFVNGLGDGVGKGVIIGERVRDGKENTKRKKALSESARAFNEYLKNNGFNNGPSGDPSNSGGNLGDGVKQQDFTGMQELGLSAVNYTDQRQGFAEGGLVQPSLSMAQDPNALVNQVDKINPRQEQMRKPSQPNKLQVAEGMANAFYAARDKALELDDGELAMVYMQKGFQAQDEVYQQRKSQAQNVFDTTGDIAPLIDVYNRNVPDDYDVQDYKKTANGYQISFTNPTGEAVTQEYTANDIRALITELDDPTARWRLQMQALQARQAKLQGMKDELTLEQGKQNIKGDTLSDGQQLYRGGRLVAENTKDIDNSKRYSTNAQGYWDKGDGSKPPVWVPNGGKDQGKDYNKEMLGVLKETKEIVLGYDGMSTMNELTGKYVPTELGNQASRVSQQLIKKNGELLPTEVAEIAAFSVKNPESNVYEKRRKSNGEIVKVPVINYKGKIFELSNQNEVKEEQPKQSAKPTEAPQQKQAPVKQEVKADEQPKQASMSLVKEAQAEETQPEREPQRKLTVAEKQKRQLENLAIVRAKRAVIKDEQGSEEREARRKRKEKQKQRLKEMQALNAANGRGK